MSGIAILRRLLMKQAMKESAPFQHEGIMSISKSLSSNVDTKIKRWVESAKKQGQDIDKMGEQEIKYILELNKPKPVKAISADSPEGKIITQGLNDMLGKASGENVIKTDFGGGVTDIVTETISVIKSKKPIEAMAEANSVLARKGKYKNLTEKQSQKIIKDTEDHIFERNVDVDPEDFAQGGRTGYFTGALADTEQGKSMSPGTRHDYSPGQGHRAVAADKQLAEIVKMHNMKAESMELPEKPKRSIKDKIGGGINRFFNNPLVRGAAAYGTFGGSEKLRAAMMAKQLYDNRKYFTDDAIEEEVSNIPTMGGMTPAYAQGGRTGTGLNYLLGEDDQNSRVPYGEGSSQSDFNQFLKEREQRDKEEEKRKFKKDYEDWKKWQKTQGGTVDFAAEGGRMGFGLGGMSRRLFLKLMGGAAAGTAAAGTGLFSLLKGGATKSVIKDLTSVPIKSGVDGMPLWFKPLVNKVIKEGEDVTKTMSTKEREIVHQVSIEGKIGKDALGVEDIRVTQSLDDGTIRVEYNSPNTIGESGVELVYKKGEEIPITKKGKSTSVTEKDEFSAVEDDFYPQQTSPDGDFDLEFTENIVKNVDDLYSDTSKLKQFATGEKLTLKEISDATKKKKILKEIENNPNEHAFRNAPDEPPYDMASGGRVPLGKGKIVKGIMSLGKKKKVNDLGGSKADPFSPDFDMGAEADLIAKTPYTPAELKQLIIKKYKGNKLISDDLLNKILADNDPQRLTEVMATIDEALLMQEKGMNPESIVQSFRDAWGRKKNASGGRVPLSGGGIAGMLGE